MITMQDHHCDMQTQGTVMPLRRSVRERKIKQYEDFVEYSKPDPLNNLCLESVRKTIPFNASRKEMVVKIESEKGNAKVLGDKLTKQNTDMNGSAQNAILDNDLGLTEKRHIVCVVNDILNTGANMNKKDNDVIKDKQNMHIGGRKRYTGVIQEFPSNDSVLDDEDIDDRDEMKEMEDIIANGSDVNISVGVTFSAVKSTEGDKNAHSVIWVCPFCRWCDVGSRNMNFHMAEKHGHEAKKRVSPLRSI